MFQTVGKGRGLHIICIGEKRAKVHESLCLDEKMGAMLRKVLEGKEKGQHVDCPCGQ